MCGIAGAVVKGRIRPEFLQAMACALSHRGPDGEGTALFDPFSDPSGDWQAGLSHRRLAVFDPSEAGAQPMRSRSGRFTLVLNGEIYNHPELRRRLPGFRWRTRTDTEVLVELLEAFGDERIDALVSAVGTGGTVSGVGRVLKQHNSDVRVIAVEPASSPVLSGGEPVSYTHLRAHET